MFPRIPFHRVNWLVSSFLIGTLFLSVTAVPLYLGFFGIDRFQIVLFFAMFGACGFSISLGYHRLFSHLTFQAHGIVRLFTVVFGAGAFENSVLLWSCQQLHRLALELLVVPFYDLFFVHAFSLFTLSFRVRKLRGASLSRTSREEVAELFPGSTLNHLLRKSKR